MSIIVLDPTYGGGVAPFALSPRLATLKGKTVGVISNGKKGTGRLFEALRSQLIAQAGVAEVILRVKSNYSAPAEAEIMADAENWDAAFTGIGD